MIGVLNWSHFRVLMAVSLLFGAATTLVAVVLSDIGTGRYLRTRDPGHPGRCGHSRKYRLPPAECLVGMCRDRAGDNRQGWLGADDSPRVLNGMLKKRTPGRSGEIVRVYEQSASTRWINEMAIDPSPTADATRLMLPHRTSPAANTPGSEVSSRYGERSSGHWAARRSSGVRSGPVLMKPFSSSVTRVFSQPVFASAPVIRKTCLIS